jgi:hypothetical protein
MRSEFATLVCVAALAASARAATAEPTAASVTGVLPRSADWASPTRAAGIPASG